MSLTLISPKNLLIFSLKPTLTIFSFTSPLSGYQHSLWLWPFFFCTMPLVTHIFGFLFIA
jgi:hypothetical protein